MWSGNVIIILTEFLDKIEVLHSPKPQSFPPVVFLEILDLDFILRSMFHLELISYGMQGMDCSSFFCIWITSCSNMIYWNNNLFSPEQLLQLCWLPVVCKMCGTISDSPFCFINLSVCLYTRVTLSCLWWLYKKLGRVNNPIISDLFAVLDSVNLHIIFKTCQSLQN